MQENLRRENLRQQLELKSSERNEQLQQAFAKALDMQHEAEKKVAALTAELTQTKRENQDEIISVTEKVVLRGHVCAQNRSYGKLNIFLDYPEHCDFYVGELET